MKIQLPDGSSMAYDLSSEEAREAARALKGSILRQEVYADDRSAKASLPYSVSERSYKLTCLQPQGPNRHVVFFSHPSETIDYHYESRGAVGIGSGSHHQWRQRMKINRGYRNHTDFLSVDPLTARRRDDHRESRQHWPQGGDIGSRCDRRGPDLSAFS